jgi:hypothetical protein
MAGAGAEQRRALVIGVDHYVHVSKRRQLGGCVNDALAVRALLVERFGVAPERIDLVLSPQPGRVVQPHRIATAPEIRAAFGRLATDVTPGDEVLVFYSGHGARVCSAATGEYLYGFAPSDAVSNSGALANLILGRELNRLVHALVARGASPTVIADTCHSGSSMRAAETGVPRRLLPESGEPVWQLSEVAWRLLAETNPVFEPEPPPPDGDAKASGWLRDSERMRDWVMLAACRDMELAFECHWHDLPGGGRRGVLTGSLLDELVRIPDAVLPSVRWSELMPALRQAMRSRSTQRPTLEGSESRPVFGGVSQPMRRGFLVTSTSESDLVDLEGGELHGLEPGAEIAIGGVIAHIERATALSSVARLPPGTSVPPDATAVLVAPGPRAVTTRAYVVPPAPNVELPRPESLLVMVSQGPADIEAIPWPGRGWVVRPYDPRGNAPTIDEVIAYLGETDDPLLSTRLGAAFVHWARYRTIRDRVSSDPTLFGLVDVALRSGTMIDGSVLHEPDPEGLYHVFEDDPLWIALRVHPTPDQRLFLGLILCSDDGNVIPLWPPSGGSPSAGGRGVDESRLPEGQSVYVGADRYTPALPVVRRNQQVSRYTFKVIACTLRDDDPPPDLSTLAISETVQEVIDAITSGRSKSGDPAPPEDARRWCTWDLPVLVSRR